MQESAPHRDMPVVYRDVLDGVARLERAGDRVAAYDIRRRAIATYSRRWDERGLQALEKLNAEAQSRLAIATRGSSVHPIAGNTRTA